MELQKNEIHLLVAKYFSYLKNKEIGLFISISEYKKFKNKEIILKGDRSRKRVFLILKGSARAYSINEDGRELNHHLRSEGYIFGDPGVFGDQALLLNTEAIGEIHLLQFDIYKLEQLGYDNPELMKFYINILKEIILVFSHRINTFVTMTAKERYLDLIKWNPLYLNNTYDKHLASFLGITPLTLHRIKKTIK